MKKIFSIALLVLALGVPTVAIVTSCVATNPGEQIVAVPAEGLKPGTVTAPGEGQEAAAVTVESLPPVLRDAVKKMYPDKPVIMLTTKEHVQEAAPAVPDNPATPEDETKPAIPAPGDIPLQPGTNPDGSTNWIGWVADTATTVVGSIPGLAQYSPLVYLAGLLLKKRPRQHLANVVAQLNPADEGYVDFKEAYASAKKAIGYEHSIESPAELRAIADKLEAKQAAGV